MTDREMYEALRREFMTLQRQKAEVEVAYGRLRSRLRETGSLCTCGAVQELLGHEGSDGSLSELV